jgi:hypothetical protein
MKKHNDLYVRLTATVLIMIACAFPIALATIGIEGRYQKCVVKVKKGHTGISYVIKQN